jgi:hypothetical protein
MNALRDFIQNEITIGADPEVFIRDQQDSFISGHIFECGTKRAPMPTPHGSVQVDGLALEFNVTPSRTPVEFLSNIHGVIKDLREIVSSRGNYDIAAVPTAEFGKKYLSTLPKHCLELGCEPDFNAYTLEPFPRPPANKTFRTGAGHIHVGWREPQDIDQDHFELCSMVAKELDYYLGIPSIEWDKDEKRRQLYGKAGCFRPKPYGVEYRVLSNAWVSDDNLIQKVFNLTFKAVHRMKANRGRAKMFDTFGGIAKSYINRNGNFAIPQGFWEILNA